MPVLTFCMVIQTIWISKILNKSTEGQKVVGCPYSTTYLQYMMAAHLIVLSN